MLSGKKILNEAKNHNPPLQVKWSVPKCKTKKNVQLQLSSTNIYRIMAVLKVETDIITSIVASFDRTSCNTSDNVYQDLQI
jgi:hypothetical protein